ncbi:MULTISPECIES: hypothetical protein [Pseudarthrobacter]|uniref:hypothetical protein n=1 Tax=Pseudarthrobacter TaxID=1742993 RepID=UPI0013DAC031|nr:MULTISPECIES: hypothetical protein [Pseudarthrobacter]MDQ0000148.1 hypothetical protein [Pseudarthrobacter sulfonivorans]
MTREDHADQTTNADSGTSRPIRVRIEAGFDSKVSIRIVPGRDLFKEPQREECSPRGDRPYAVRPIPFPADLVEKLVKANTAVIGWLAKDKANAEKFIHDPLVALERAGVELSRAEAKALSRSHGALRDEAVLPPGAAISTLTVSATTRGKIGDIRPSKRPHDTPDADVTGTAGDPGC